MKVPSHCSSRGFTLIELVITIIILGSVSLILVPFFTAIIHSPDPMLRQRAIALGQALMDEITAKKWDENTPLGGLPICTGESPTLAARPALIDGCLTTATQAADLGPEEADRTDYDDIDDYHNPAGEADTFTDQNGRQFTLAGFKRRVKVCYIASNTNPVGHEACDSPVAGTTDTKVVVVTVESPRGETFHFVSAVCNL